jgi:Fe-S oxidoreductase
MLNALALNLKEEEEPYTCCGFCGIFSIKNPDISLHMWQKKKEKIFKSGSELIATDCPGCLLQLRANLKSEKRSFKIFHTAELYERVIQKRFKTQKRH